jgi:hypothetical protein
VRQAGGGESLAAHALGTSALRERYPLDSHLSVQELVARSPDHPKAACSEALKQAIAAEEEVLCSGRIAPLLKRGWLADAIGAWRPTGLDESVRRLHRILRFAIDGAAPWRT